MTNEKVNKINSFTYFLIILVSALIIAPLFQQGLFIDGLLYKTVATNFYWGDASFWKMKFNDVSMNPFYEQPPFFFFITGGFYKIFGNSHLADKMLTLLFLALSVFLLARISKILFKDISAFHITLFLLLTIPVLSWTYVNQVIETLVLPLSLAGFYLYLCSRQNNQIIWQRMIYSLLFSATIVLLFLTKGFQSCFIILVPFLYSVFFKDKNALYFGLISGLIISCLLYLLIFVYEPSSVWFGNYMQKRLVASLNKVGATTTYRAEIIIRTITELILPLILVAIYALSARLKKNDLLTKHKEEKRIGWILLVVALSGSIPFAITLEQRGFYLVPSFPFFILSLIMFFKEPLRNFHTLVISFFSKKIPALFLLLLFLLSLAYLAVSPDRYKRDENLLNDLKLLEPYLKTGDTVSVDDDSWNDSALQSYLFMKYKVNVEGNYSHHFYIHDRQHNTLPNPEYEKIDIPSKQYDFFQKKRGALATLNQ